MQYTTPTALQNPKLLASWHKYQTQPEVADEKEFELGMQLSAAHSTSH